MGRKEHIKKEIFLEDLPRWRFGKAKTNGEINWENSIGYIINGVYDNMLFEVEIIDYKERYLYIKYLDKPTFKITTSGLTSCRIGNLLGIQTGKFKIEIGTILKDEKRDIIITDREYRRDKNSQNRKWYKYTCNKCGWTEGWAEESKVIGCGYGCSCCYGRTVVEGINDIPTTAPWMVKYFQGGYDEAKLYTKCSDKKIIPVCLDCGIVSRSMVKVANIYNQHTIGCSCSDKTSYPEKLMFNVLKQLNIDFIVQLNKTTFNWCGKYKYDFYIPSLNIIIETHGNQHYDKGFECLDNKRRTLKEEKVNDKIKRELAIKNGVNKNNYISIDCKKSELEFIKQNILSSKLNNMINLSIINWSEVEIFALSNRVKQACDLWNCGIKSTKEIGEIMKLDRHTICNYLKKGQLIEWCNYNAKSVIRTDKRVKIFKDGVSLRIFPSCAELSRKSEELFGIKLSKSKISEVCLGRINNHKGFTFQYI